jgi:hypothetical protein
MLNTYIIVQSRDRSRGMATGYGLDGGGSIPGSGKIFHHPSRPPLEVTQSPIQ